MAQPPNGGAQGGGSLVSMFMPMIIIFGIFYFLMIRPQQKQQKKTKEMLSALQKGDEIVTRSGMHATIFGLTDTIVTLEISEGIRVKINRDQVAYKKNGETN